MRRCSWHGAEILLQPLESTLLEQTDTHTVAMDDPCQSWWVCPKGTVAPGKATCCNRGGVCGGRTQRDPVLGTYYNPHSPFLWGAHGRRR